MVYAPVTLLQIAFEMDILMLYNLLFNSIEGHDKKYVSIDIELTTHRPGNFCEFLKIIFMMIKTCGTLQIS